MQILELGKSLPRKYVRVQQNIRSQDKKAKYVMYLFSDGSNEYDFLLRLLSLGRDRYWRASVIKDIMASRGTRALDVACGTGVLSFELAKTGAEVIGVDITKEMLIRAKNLRTKYSIDVEFIQARAENLPVRSGSFGCAVISLATRNVSSVAETFGEMKRATKDCGRVVSLDFARPRGDCFRYFYFFYIFKVLPALGILISRHWNGIFSYLANSIFRSREPEEIARIMRMEGLSNIALKRMTRGVTALVSGTKPSPADRKP